MKAIAHGFDVQLRDIRQALAKGDAIPRGCGEHLALGEDIEPQRIDWIPKNAQNHTAVNRIELLHYLPRGFQSSGYSGTGRFFLSVINSSYRRCYVDLRKTGDLKFGNYF
jgi:hypothetical protein